MRARTARRGGLTVEFALTISLAFFFFFAAMEFCRVAQLRHAVDHATYEACRAGIIPGATVQRVEAKAREVMGTTFARNLDVRVQPNPIRPDSDKISVTVGVPLDQNLFVPARFFAGKRFDRTFTMERELASKPQ
jgi:hypothetical protein